MTRAAIARAFALLGLGALMALFVYWVRMPQNLLWANNGYAMAMNGTWGFWESAVAIVAYWFYALWGRAVSAIGLAACWCALAWLWFLKDWILEGEDDTTHERR